MTDDKQLLNHSSHRVYYDDENSSRHAGIELVPDEK